MLLKDLMSNYSGKMADVEITGVTSDSRKVKQGFAFVCIAGTAVDGHSFAEAAVKSGAAVIIAERDTGFDNQILVEDTHSEYAHLCANWFGNPAEKLHLIGVTGTNGKTSVTYMLKSILEAAGHRVGLVGTIQNMIDDRVIEAKNTTPDAYALNELFSEMLAAGCSYAVMEVSSHALDQRRVCDLKFEVAAFTNLTQDHLDYHKTMENYLEAKKRLFAMAQNAVINLDDEYSEALINGLNCNVFTYSTGNDSSFSAKGIKYYPAGVEYELFGDGILRHISVSTGGKFTVYNSMCAAVVALKAGISIDAVAEGLAALSGVKGRAEVVPTNTDYTVIIDYAHTPDGLKNILLTFKECEKNRLIVLFGCGGDRDRTKRPRMGSIAARYADYVVVTSDNPRTENPTAIIEDILEGMQGLKTPMKVIENRVEAIEYALSIATSGDIIVLAGKGHETYQILNSGTIHLDEREVIADYFKNKGI